MVIECGQKRHKKCWQLAVNCWNEMWKKLIGYTEYSDFWNRTKHDMWLLARQFVANIVVLLLETSSKRVTENISKSA